MTFISCLYGVHVSDKKITQVCGLIDLFESDDVVRVDRGFDIQNLQHSKCVTLNIPPLLQGKEQLSFEEEIETRSIASIHICVERAIEWVKNYRILQGVIPISLHAQLDEIWFICSILTNFLPTLVQ